MFSLFLIPKIFWQYFITCPPPLLSTPWARQYICTYVVPFDFSIFSHTAQHWNIGFMTCHSSWDYTSFFIDPKCTESDLKKSPNLFHLGSIWPTLCPNLVALVVFLNLKFFSKKLPKIVFFSFFFDKKLQFLAIKKKVTFLAFFFILNGNFPEGQFLILCSLAELYMYYVAWSSISASSCMHDIFFLFPNPAITRLTTRFPFNLWIKKGLIFRYVHLNQVQ